MPKFWNFVEHDEEECELFFDGPIAEESWWGDEMTPQAFREELNKCGGKRIKLRINSPGGDCTAASVIYSDLLEYPGDVVAQIDGMAASAASVIAMAATKVVMVPTAMMMIHDPMMCACGNAQEMQKAVKTLDEVKESIINAYEQKTGLGRTKIANLMSEETWMSAFKARELGFCDEVLGGDAVPHNSYCYTVQRPVPQKEEPKGVSTEKLKRQLDLLKLR